MTDIGYYLQSRCALTAHLRCFSFFTKNRRKMSFYEKDKAAYWWSERGGIISLIRL